MAALTKDRDTVRKEGVEIPVPMAASTKVYAGSGVCTNATGYAVPAVDTAAFFSAGVAQEQVDNSAGADGALNVRVRRHGCHKFAASGITQADIGKKVYWVDDQTVALSTTNSVLAGVIDEVISATEVYVDVDRI